MVIDTNVLIAASNSSAEFHEACRSYIDSRVRDAEPTFLTMNVCYEFFRVSTHIAVFDNPFTGEEALDFIKALINSPGFHLLTPTDRHFEVLRQVLREMPELRGGIMHDVHTAVLMREHGLSKICSQDGDFHRFPFLEVIDPLRQ